MQESLRVHHGTRQTESGVRDAINYLRSLRADGPGYNELIMERSAEILEGLKITFEDSETEDEPVKLEDHPSLQWEIPACAVEPLKRAFLVDKLIKQGRMPLAADTALERERDVVDPYPQYRRRAQSILTRREILAANKLAKSPEEQMGYESCSPSPSPIDETWVAPEAHEAGRLIDRQTLTASVEGSQHGSLKTDRDPDLERFRPTASRSTSNLSEGPDGVIDVYEFPDVGEASPMIIDGECTPASIEPSGQRSFDINLDHPHRLRLATSRSESVLSGRQECIQDAHEVPGAERADQVIDGQIPATATEPSERRSSDTNHDPQRFWRVATSSERTSGDKPEGVSQTPNVTAVPVSNISVRASKPVEAFARVEPPLVPQQHLSRPVSSEAGGVRMEQQDISRAPSKRKEAAVVSKKQGKRPRKTVQAPSTMRPKPRSPLPAIEAHGHMGPDLPSAKADTTTAARPRWRTIQDAEQEEALKALATQVKAFGYDYEDDGRKKQGRPATPDDEVDELLSTDDDADDPIVCDDEV